MSETHSLYTPIGREVADEEIRLERSSCYDPANAEVMDSATESVQRSVNELFGLAKFIESDHRINLGLRQAGNTEVLTLLMVQPSERAFLPATPEARDTKSRHLRAGQYSGTYKTGIQIARTTSEQGHRPIYCIIKESHNNTSVGLESISQLHFTESGALLGSEFTRNQLSVQGTALGQIFEGVVPSSDDGAEYATAYDLLQFSQELHGIAAKLFEVEEE